MDTRIAELNGLRVAYETLGDEDRPPMVLVMGLGMQMIGWHDDFCRALAERHFVVRFDNRDVGESTHIDAPTPHLQACLAGDTSSAPYTLEDMADDVIGLVDELGLKGVHVVGASMGGMIAQTVALRHPARVRSLTSIMSTTGEREVSQPTPAATAVLFQPPARTREEAVERALEAAWVIGSPGFPRDEEWIAERAARSFDRGYDPPGFARQLSAIYASGDRTEALRSLRIPTLVVHGEADPLVPLSGGKATAAAIAGAELWTVPGMAHDLPRPVWPELIRRIGSLVELGEGRLART